MKKKKRTRTQPPPTSEQLPKLLGADIELCNFLEFPEDHLPSAGSSEVGTGYAASRLLLRHMPGIPGTAYAGYGGYYQTNPQDVGRKWSDNGSCNYIDLDHLEICLPETTNAWAFTAALRAQFQIVQAARQRAAETLKAGVALHVLACNSDGNGTSWGSHLNFMVSRACYENIFHRRLHYLLYLASYQASSAIIVGQGKVGSENGAPPVEFQLSQRADFIEEIVALQTTFRRPIINSRDEPLSGLNSRCARFHHIACDVNLQDTANVLKVGILQLLLAMVESESTYIEPGVILQDPVGACTAFSHAPDLDARQPTLAGEELTALDLQRRFYDAAAAFVETGACDAIVPRARDILSLWHTTLDLLAAQDWEALSRRLDWVLKRRILQDVMAENGLDWQASSVKSLDLQYGNLDPEEGLYWALEAGGFVDRLVSDEDVLRFVTEPPLDTRAYTRSHLLRAFGREGVSDVDWDSVKVRVHPERGYYSLTQTINLDDPAGFTQAETGGLFEGTEIARAEVLAALSQPASSVSNASALAVVADPPDGAGKYTPTNGFIGRR